MRVARFKNKRKEGCKISQLLKPLSTTPGHLAMTRFSSLLSVINIDSLFVCLQMTLLSFLLLLRSGKLPLRRCVKSRSMQRKRGAGIPHSSFFIVYWVAFVLTHYQNVQFICTLAAIPRSLPTQPVTPRSMVIGLLPGFTCQPSSSMPLLPFTLGLGASPLTL